MVRPVDWQWRSGGVLAAGTAAGAATAHLSLRATSDGSTPTAVSALGALLLALVLWPFAARAGRVVPLAALLAVAQFGGHALGVLSAGQARSAAALVCCPSTSQLRPGPIGELTAQAGWALAVAQLLVCILLAFALRAGRSGTDLVAQALRLAGELLGSGCRRIQAAVLLLRTLAAPVAPTHSPRPTRRVAALRPQRHSAGPQTRRGPPTTTRPVVHAAG